VVVQSLRHEFERQRVRHSARLLQLGALVLEPDFDLRLVEDELRGEPLSALLGQVAAGVELAPENAQLVAVERRSRPLVVRGADAAAVARDARRGTARRGLLPTTRLTRSWT